MVVAVVAATIGIGGLIRRDELQQRRIEQLSARLGEVSEAVKALEPPLRVLPVLLAQQRCAVDPKDLERIRSPPSAATAATKAMALEGKLSPAQLSTEQRAALGRANQQLDAAISRHSLTRDDVLQMRAELATVGSIQESEALRARIATAINHQELVPKDRLFIMP